MNTQTEIFNKSQVKKLPDIRPGDTVKIHQKIKEGDPSSKSGQVKERIQIFEGVVIAKKHGKGISATITVRKVVDGVGVERILPIHSPSISKVEIVNSGKARRSKLYYLRQVRGKKAKLKKKDFIKAIIEEEPVNVEIPKETPLENAEVK